jgi:hypothetical protein
VDYNPYLRKARGAPGAGPRDKGSISRPGEEPNLRWQTRSAPPTEFENRLGDTLEQVFDGGAESLAEVVRGLNERGLRAPDGAPWTEQSFQTAMQRLAAS